MVKFAYTILYVKNVKKSLEFYSKAFGFKIKFIAPGDVYGELVSGETTLSFAAVSLAKSNLSKGFQQSRSTGKPFAVEVAFATHDVEGLMKKAVKLGAKSYEKAKKKPWGQTVGYLKDPDGFLIEVCTPMN
jgi:lactoylglutathione lyase